MPIAYIDVTGFCLSLTEMRSSNVYSFCPALLTQCLFHVLVNHSSSPPYIFGAYVHPWFPHRVWVLSFVLASALYQLPTCYSVNWPLFSCLISVSFKRPKLSRPWRGHRHYLVWPEVGRRRPGRCFLPSSPWEGPPSGGNCLQGHLSVFC